VRIDLVQNDAQAKEWLLFPLEIYKNDPNYIRPLDKDIEDVFNPAANKFFKFGDCERWLLKSDTDKIIGRIAVFTSRKWKNTQPTGGVGFFECIQDQAAANFLFDAAVVWLKERGMEAMDGPVNFGERDKWWGLLVKGFEEPLYNMNYNPPYYVELFENYGFQVYFNQVCPGMSVEQQLSDKFLNLHKKYENNPDFTAEHIRIKELDKFTEDFVTIYNKAFAQHGGGKELDLRQAKFMFGKMKDIIDEKVVWFVYHKGDPIAMWINIPDLNQYFKHFNGKLGWWQKIQFVFMRYRKMCKRFVGVVYGVVPEFQGKGVDAYMIVECSKVVQPSKRYLKYEMQWLGDFNPKMLNLAKNLEAAEVRRLSTYRYLFDRTIEFERHPIL
jgi:hypothetical protein